MADDKIIRNPNRFREQKPTISKYVPEWQKYGLEPIVSKVNPEDFNMQQRRPRPDDTDEDRVPVEMAPIPEYVPIQPPNTVREKPQDLPPETSPHKVSVGVHKNWFEIHSGTETNDEVLYDEIPSPPEMSDEQFEVSDDVPTESSDEPTLADVEPTHYALFVKGALIYSSQLIGEIEKIIEEILFDQESLGNLTLDDIVLVKRIPLKVGVLAVG